MAVEITSLDPISFAASPRELQHFHDVDPDEIFFNVVKGRKLDTDVRASIIDGSVEDAIDFTPNIKITIHDPDWELLNSGALTRAIDLKIGKRWYRLSTVDVNDDDVTCTFIIRNAVYLMHHNKRKVVSRAKSTRAEFILVLVRSVKKVKIKFICKQLHKKQKIESVRINRDEKRQKGLPRGKDADGLTIKGKQADSEQLNNAEAIIDEGEEMGAPRRALVGGIMCPIQEATMRRSATAGQFVGLFQQSSRYGWPATRDPRKDSHAFFEKFIPLVRASPNADLGTLIAKVQRPLDPVGFALGANRWRAEAEDIVDAYVGGGGITSREYKKRYDYEIEENSDGTNENYLAAIYRLAEQVGWRAFWVGNDLHYESEEDLFKSRFRMRIERDDIFIDGISFTINEQRKTNEMVLRVLMRKWIAPIGAVVAFGPPAGTKMIAGARVRDNPANGRWLVTNVRRPLFSELGEITLSKPIEEKLEPSPDIGTRQVDDGGNFSNSLGSSLGGAGAIDDSEGARSIVESAAFLAGCPSGMFSSTWLSFGTRVVSDHRRGDSKDHGSNDSDKAARDIAFKNVNALTGPPHRNLDIACKHICDAFNRPYNLGSTIIDSFNWHGYRIQIIWRTPLYGGHMGHIHIGAKQVVFPAPQTRRPDL